MLSYKRKTESLHGDKTVYYNVDVETVKQYKEITGNAELPDWFVTAMDINPVDRVKLQGAVQQVVDTAISSTVNLPKETTVEQIEQLYLNAWKSGCKGITCYRSGCRDAVLSSVDSQTTTVDKPESKLDSIEPISRSKLGNTLTGTTTKYKTACGTLYITVNKDEEGNIVEIFTNSSKNGTCKANLNGETRLASLALRAGVKVNEVIDSLRSIQCQSCAFARARNKNAVDGSSCPDIISKCLMKAYNTAEVGKSVKCVNDDTRTSTNKDDTVTNNSGSDICPECGGKLIHTGGCVSCTCGYSRCG